MEITNSLDWPKVELALWAQVNGLQPKYLYDVRKMINAITKMVTELSKKELLARTTHGRSTRHADAYRDEINTQIKNLEQWIMIGMLS